MPTKNRLLRSPFSIPAALSTVAILAGSVVATAGCQAQPTAAPQDVAQPEPEPATDPEEAEAPTATYEDAIGATVLITTPWGHGTGVFVDANGLILTNYHVISPGKSEDFGYEAQVTTATLQEDGSVELGDKLSAQAYKVDPKRDLALLKVEHSDRKFSTLPVATDDPKPGRQVSAIGNAGVGFGWAVKRCSINAIGTYDAFASVIFSKQQQDAGNDNPVQKAMLEEFTKAAGEKGKQIQTDCNVLPGDSGGPLIDNETYQLLGLNVSIRSATAGFSTLGSVAFHIHVAEIRDFLQEIPTRPDLDIPDPWQVAGGYGAFADSDLDGEYDTIRFEGICNENLRCLSNLTDLDQDSFGGKRKLPALDEVRKDKAFDAELAILLLGRPPRQPGGLGLPVSDRLIYADADNDGHFDRLLIENGETGKVRGYRLFEDGAERDESIDDLQLTQVAKLFADKRLRKRAKALTGDLGASTHPDKASALEARLEDHSGDGKLDTVHARTRIDDRVLIDLDQDALVSIQDKARRHVLRRARGSQSRRLLAQFAGREATRQLRTGKLHGEFLAVAGTPARVFYDTDLDGHYDLVLEGPSMQGVAFAANTLDAEGRRTPTPEHVGRRLLRPALMNDAEQAKTLEQMMAGAFRDTPRAALQDGVSSFPEIRRDRIVAVREVEDTGGAGLTVLDAEATTVVLDLDGDTFKGKGKGLSPIEAVREDAFDAEFAYRVSSGMAWAFYDADDDGRFDLVLVSVPGLPSTVGTAFEIDDSGKVSVAADRRGQPLLQADVFSGSRAKKLFGKVKQRIESGALR